MTTTATHAPDSFAPASSKPGVRAANEKGGRRALRLPSKIEGRLRTDRAGRRQVFGLAGAPAVWPGLYWPPLPGPSRDQCFVAAVVPTHRCGAVPVSHRIPFGALRGRSAPATGHYISR